MPPNNQKINFDINFIIFFIFIVTYKVSVQFFGCNTFFNYIIYRDDRISTYDICFIIISIYYQPIYQLFFGCNTFERLRLELLDKINPWDLLLLSLMDRKMTWKSRERIKKTHQLIRVTNHVIWSSGSILVNLKISRSYMEEFIPHGCFCNYHKPRRCQ